MVVCAGAHVSQQVGATLTAPAVASVRVAANPARARVAISAVAMTARALPAKRLVRFVCASALGVPCAVAALLMVAEAMPRVRSGHR
jgi:hypothetical protein